MNYGRIAAEIIRSLRPRSVFDAGCCRELVDALRERGVSIAAGPPHRCDLLTCLNVPEPRADVLAAADTVLFSSADSASEVARAWFADHGFAP